MRRLVLIIFSIAVFSLCVFYGALKLKCIEIIMTAPSPAVAIHKAKVLHELLPYVVTETQIAILERLYGKQ
jgi:hypothetical protein